MTITPTMMYWFTRLDGLHTFFCVGTFFTTIAFIFILGFFIASKFDDSCEEPIKKLMSSLFKIITPVWLLFLSGVLFVPTTKEMAMIYVVPQLTESQVVKQDIPELYDLGVNALKEWLKKDETDGNNN